MVLAKNGSLSCISVLIYRNSKLSDKCDFMLGEIGDHISAREEFLIQYYDRAPRIPKDIYIDAELNETDNIRQVSDGKIRSCGLHQQCQAGRNA